MTVTVVSANSHKEFTTLIQVKAELGITASSADGLLVSLIQAASDRIETYTGRTFAKEQVTESFGSDGRLTQLLERTPVISIDTVKYNGSTTGVSSTQIEIRDSDAGIIFRDYNNEGWKDDRILVQNIEPSPTRWKNNKWEITYTAGYVMPGEGSTSSSDYRTLPHDLEHACVQLVKSMWHARTLDPNVAIRRVGDASETRYLGLQKASMDPQTQSILDKYVRVDIPLP